MNHVTAQLQASSFAQQPFLACFMMEDDTKSEGRKDIKNFVATKIHSIGTKIILIGNFQNESGIYFIIIYLNHTA
jgi:hypothetical protein